MSWKFHTRKSLMPQAVLVLMMVLIESGCAIECFVCDSSVNPGCTNLRSNSSIVPETCTLEKMKTIDTWLFELNEIAYFKAELENIPPMNCQKVVARQNSHMQQGSLDLLRKRKPKLATSMQLPFLHGHHNGLHRSMCDADSEPVTARFCQLDTRDTDACSILKDKLMLDENLMHCSICSTDRCNGSERINIPTILGYLCIASLFKVFG